MTIIKFTVDSAGDDLETMVDAATEVATKFYKDLPGKFRVKDISASYDEAYYQAQVSGALKEAEDRAKAWSEAHPDEDPAEAVPAHVFLYNGWIEFEYDIEQNFKPGKKTLNEVLAENNVGGEVYSGPPENDPKYQDAF